MENAIKYNNQGGWVHISLNSDHQFFYIKVEDNGLGIAITKSAIAMHNGEVKVRSKLGEGSTFDVRIPLNYIEKENQ